MCISIYIHISFSGSHMCIYIYRYKWFDDAHCKVQQLPFVERIQGGFYRCKLCNRIIDHKHLISKTHLSKLDHVAKGANVYSSNIYIYTSITSSCDCNQQDYMCT